MTKSRMQFRRNHHYVPQAYLKRWCGQDNRVWVYRLLVSDHQVPLWNRLSVRGLARVEHLYTRVVGRDLTDEFERWLEREIETPAQEPLRKATSDERMTSDDWTCLIRFVAAQDLRTPASLQLSMLRWRSDLPALMKEILPDLTEELQEAIAGKDLKSATEIEHQEPLPLRVSMEKSSEEERKGIRVQVVPGRALWLWSQKERLTRSWKVLLKHKWTVLRASEGSTWLTTDRPVIRLNYVSSGKYDFGGGWDRQGSEIILPLSPSHLLYTLIGGRPPLRGHRLTESKSQELNKLIAEHAHRMIFAHEPDDTIPEVRRRVVSRSAFQSEYAERKSWHDRQAAAEQKLFD